jgi:dolichol-phosphate mannosyltransferase
VILILCPLQHPPEAVQKLIDALDDPTTPIALGTRYAPGVEMDKNWPWYRHVISWGARSLARPLTSASDPMTGFFGIRKELVSVVFTFLSMEFGIWATDYEFGSMSRACEHGK